MLFEGGAAKEAATGAGVGVSGKAQAADQSQQKMSDDDSDLYNVVATESTVSAWVASGSVSTEMLNANSLEKSFHWPNFRYSDLFGWRGIASCPSPLPKDPLRSRRGVKKPKTAMTDAMKDRLERSHSIDLFSDRLLGNCGGVTASP